MLSNSGIPIIIDLMVFKEENAKFQANKFGIKYFYNMPSIKIYEINVLPN